VIIDSEKLESLLNLNKSDEQKSENIGMVQHKIGIKDTKDEEIIINPHSTFGVTRLKQML